MNKSNYEQIEIDFCNSPAGVIRIGTEIYNGGDMANNPHFGTVTKIMQSPAFGVSIEINPEGGSGRQKYTMSPCLFSEKYLGHGGTRIVTKSAYQQYRDQILKQYSAR